MSKNYKMQPKINKKLFFCPLGHCIMWNHGLEYKECPLTPSYRDMPECKSCKLQIDEKWESNKENWKYEPVKKKKRKQKKDRRKNKKPQRK